MAQLQGRSAFIMNRVRAFRTLHRLTQAEAADGITRHGYPISRAQLGFFENGRRKELPYDFVEAAARFFVPSSSQFGISGSELMAFLYGPLCTNCHDDPPRKYACMTCRRYRNDDGEVVPC